MKFPADEQVLFMRGYYHSEDDEDDGDDCAQSQVVYGRVKTWLMSSLADMHPTHKR